MEDHMKFKALALATTLALFLAVPFSRADSACAAGNIDYLLNAPCTIGNTEFDFTGSPLLDINITPVSTDPVVGFTITGEEGESFAFTATPLTGEFTSYTADCLGSFVCQLNDANQGTIAMDNSGVQSTTGSPASSFNGNFQTGVAPTATFTFTESSPASISVPEGSELGMLGIAAVGLLGGMKRRFL
jgi:hypothetical protein